MSAGLNPAALTLQDGAKIAVIGGGPSGAFFSIYALEMAQRVGKNISVTVFDPKDFTRTGPAGCNRCGGIVSELMVQALALDGILLPDAVVRRGINAYNLYTEHGDVTISAVGQERRIASVYRAGGPPGGSKEHPGFDRYLLDLAQSKGATHVPLKVDDVKLRNGRPVLSSEGRELLEADLLVGAFGLSKTAELFESLGFGYRRPPATMTAIAELRMTEAVVRELFGTAIALFLLPDDGLKFAAMIPKGEHVTLCLLGSGITADTVKEFLAKPVVRKALPEMVDYQVACMCLPKMSVGAPTVAYRDRIVVCGDSGSTRLFKDGIGAAYLMAKAVAKTAVFHGVGRNHFREVYQPVYSSIVTDNRYGRLLYAVTDIIRKQPQLTRGMLKTVAAEQEDDRSEQVLSDVLWGMFTGNERYREIFPKTLSPTMNLRLVTNSLKAFRD